MLKRLDRNMSWLAIAAVLMGAAAAGADTLHLQNGDRVSGKLIKLEEGTITFETDYAGRLEIDRQAVDRLFTDDPVAVHLAGEELLLGLLASQNGELTVASSGARESARIRWDQVTAINPAPRQRPQWKGDFTLGGNQQSGNTDRVNASLSLDAVRKADDNRINIRLLYNYSEEDDEITSRNTYGMLKYDYFLTERFYWYLDFEFLEDEFKDLNLRTAIGPGLGYQVWDQEKKFLLFEGGISYFNEDHIDSEDTRWFSGRLATEFRYTFFDRLEFSDKLAIFPSLENFGDYQLRNEASLSTPLFASWSMKLTHILERDSDPAPRVKKNDYNTILGLQYKF